MTIEEMKARLVENEMEYIQDLVITNKYDELFEFVYLNCFSNFKSMSDEEIKEHFVKIYGNEILANPPKKGFDILVWLAPLFFGFFGIVFLYRYIFP